MPFSIIYEKWFAFYDSLVQLRITTNYIFEIISIVYKNNLSIFIVSVIASRLKQQSSIKMSTNSMPLKVYRSWESFVFFFLSSSSKFSHNLMCSIQFNKLNITISWELLDSHVGKWAHFVYFWIRDSIRNQNICN